MIYDIEKNYFHQLAALAERLSEIGLFACSSELSCKSEKYYKVTSVKECTPIVYEDETIIRIIFKQFLKTFVNGQDKDYQPTMRVEGDELKKGNILIYADNENANQYTDGEEAYQDRTVFKDLPEHVSGEEWLNIFDKDVTDTGAKIIMIENGTSIVNHATREKFANFNRIAEKHDLMVFVGINVSQTTNEANDYLANYAHNLCRLTKGFLSTSTELEGYQPLNYINFEFGRPTPHSVCYAIDDNGCMTTFNDMLALLRMDNYGKRFLNKKSIKVSAFTDMIYGALGGEFERRSAYAMIGKAVSHNVLQRNGTDKKEVYVSLPDRKNADKPCTNRNVAISALAHKPQDVHRKYARMRRPLFMFGDFKIICTSTKPPKYEDYYSEEDVSKIFIRNLIETIIKGQRKYLDFLIKTKHRKTLLILVGDDDNRDWWTGIEAKEGIGFDTVLLDEQISDTDFLHQFKTCALKSNPDFVFVVGLEKVKRDHFDMKGLSKEMGIVATKQSFVGIALHVGYGGLDGIPDKNLCCIDKIEWIYRFSVEVDGWQFKCYFRDKGVELQSGELREAYFYHYLGRCNKTPISEITSSTPLTPQQISKAKKDGWISIEYRGRKSMENALVTYNR